MNYIKGYIYIRDNELCQLKNIYKLGKTSNIKNRNDTYITSEHKRGNFIYVVEIPYNKMDFLEKILQNYFHEYNNYIDGGKEYFNREIIDLIEPFLKKINIEYKILTKEEIELFDRYQRLKNNKLINNFINKYKNKKIEPNEHQKEVLLKIEDYYLNNNIGKLIWACGLGKTLMSIFIIQQLKFKIILYGVPNNNLQNQLKDDILKIFNNKKNILLVGSYDINSTTENINIKKFINNKDNNEPKFIITTYQSCYLLLNYKFDFKIGDEAHHLVNIEKDKLKQYTLFHKIEFKKSLFMTATEKIIETKLDKIIYTMNDENIFGKYIDKKTIKWAIDNNKITDYNILLLDNKEEEIIDIIKKLNIDEIINIELFMSCYTTLKSIEENINLTHLLLYTNTIKEAELTKKYINYILTLYIIKIKDIYNNSLYSTNKKILNKELEKFKNSKYGIISCVYLFGEGFDLPKLNGICIACNMNSNIRIIQYLLRPNRLEKGNPDKIAYYILPFIENKENNKLSYIIQQIRNEDKNIEQKITLGIYDKINKKYNKNKLNDINDKNKLNIIEYEELNKLKLKLINSKLFKSDFTIEQNEYNYIKSINKKLNIKSKNDYYDNKLNHENFINLPDDYFKSKGVWIDWYDFLDINKDNLIKNKSEWKKFCIEKNIKTKEDYKKCLELYDILPKDPVELYKDFSNLSNELFELNNNRT